MNEGRKSKNKCIKSALECTYISKGDKKIKQWEFTINAKTFA